MHTPESQSLFISRDTTLTKAGLMSGNRPVELGHREQFAQFVFLTEAAVVDILSSVFPVAVAVPLENGGVQPSSELAWQHYTRQVMALRSHGSNTEEFRSTGRTILQWCQAAVLAGVTGTTGSVEAPEFLAVSYLAKNGGQALACNEAQWIQYLKWLNEECTPAAVVRQLEGLSRPNPRPAAVGVVAPWPEDLGAELTGAGGRLDKVLRVASDIRIVGDKVLLRIGSILVPITLDTGLVEAFEAMKPPSTASVVERRVVLKTEVDEYVFRSQRMQLSSGTLNYSFRRLDMSACSPTLTSLCVNQL